MRARINLTGQKIGRLFVLGVAPKEGAHKQLRWLCRCDCGRFKTIVGYSLRHQTRSCGCLSIERRTIHGANPRVGRAPEYTAYYGARQRCENPKSTGYKDYGGRGILFLFDSYQHFLFVMGARPDGSSLDRIDVNGHYSPENCRWATPEQQADNRRDSRYLDIDGKRVTVMRWAKNNKSVAQRLYTRLNWGWCQNCALHIPPFGGRCPHLGS